MRVHFWVHFCRANLPCWVRAALPGDAPEVQAAQGAILVDRHDEWRGQRRESLVDAGFSRAEDVDGGRRRQLAVEAIEKVRTRVAASLLIEQNDDWLVGRRDLSEGSMALVLGRSATQETTLAPHALHNHASQGSTPV